MGIQEDCERVHRALIERGAEVATPYPNHGVTLRAVVPLLQHPGQTGWVCFTLSDTTSGARYLVNVQTGEAVLVGERSDVPQSVRVSKSGLDKIRSILAANRV